jgi:DNA-directed RNA polymerase subunit RPC12/RpoP
MNSQRIEVGLKCSKCGSDFEIMFEITPAEVAELAKKREKKRVPTRCPNCGDESETILDLLRIGPG